MMFTIKEIAGLLNASTKGESSIEAVAHFSIDTRNLPFAKETLFFALRGYKNDGHTFIPEAYDMGTRYFVVDRNRYSGPYYDNAVFFHVDNTIAALQHLAKKYRMSLARTHFTGITGSNGKTIVKEWLANLLSPFTSVGRSPGSYNSKIGVPLSVLSIKSSDQMALIEAGISKTEEMDILADIISPDTGIFTGIGSAHDEGFISVEQKIQEKIKLFASSKTIIFPGDNEKIRLAITVAYPEKNLVSWGANRNSILLIENLTREKSAVLVTVSTPKGIYTFRLRSQDSASIENAMSCFAFLYSCGMLNDEILLKFYFLEPLKNRLEFKNGIYNSILLNDSYSADLSGFRVAYNFLSLMAADRKKILILSDFALQKEERFREDIKTSIAQIVNDQPVFILITIGIYLADISTWLKTGVLHFHFESVKHFLKEFDRSLVKDTGILVKGSRLFALEEIVNEFSIRQHQTFLEIDLTALTHNLNTFASLLDRKTKIMVMVKAAAYGAGSVEIAAWLQNQHIDYLGVAYADEGVELRESGIKLPIIVLNTDSYSFENLVRYGLEPEIFSIVHLNQFITFLKNHDLLNFPIHLKIETGMNRLGFRTSDFGDLFDILKENQTLIRVASIFSHLSSADDPAEDAFTDRQVKTLTDFHHRFGKELGYSPMKHILNTSGILRFPEYQMDMVRLGIGIYGLVPKLNPRRNLIHSLTLKSVVSQIKTIQAGESVSYGRAWRADRPTRIATVGIGYADGLRRDAGKKGVFIYIHGKPAPIVGNICMDMCIIDVSNIPEVKTGDETIIFSPDYPISVLAEKLDTIPYEILTSISKRVQRVYINA